MTHHDVPFVVSLIWLAALNGGMILLLLWWMWPEASRPTLPTTSVSRRRS